MQKIRLGADSKGPYELTEFSGGQLPFEIGSLERYALSYLGDWKTVKSKKEHFGFYYRMGIKDGVIDADGDPATAILHFVAPFIREGHAMTPQIQATLDQRVARAIQLSTIVLSQTVDNTIGIRVSPPD